jgi:hypothetical protein
MRKRLWDAQVAEGLEAKYPFKLEYRIDWPKTLTHNGMLFSCTGKSSTSNKDGCPFVEYENNGYTRIHLRLDGQISNA